MTSRPRRLRLPTFASSIPVWVLLAGLAATATAAYYAEDSARAQERIRFDSAVQHVSGSITSRVDTYVALLRAGAGLFAANRNVSYEQFGQFARRLDLRGRYPGIQGIGFAARVPASHLDAFVAAQRAGGRPDFHIWPDTPRDIYFPILYLEPEDRRNRAAIGYDMFTEPVRHAAMQAAARTGTAAATGRVTLVQEIDPQKQPGFLIYAPVYEPDAATSSSGTELRGFIYSPFRAVDFLSSAFKTDDTPAVAIRVSDGGPSAGQDRLLYQSHPGLRHAGRYSATATVDVAGRPWLIAVQSLPAFEQGGERRLLPWIVVVGLLVTFGLVWATGKEVKARAAAERAAEQLRRSEEALRASEAKLLQLVEAERQAHAEAAAANRAKDDFLATLSHELRTPLNAIIGWAAMLKSGRLDEQQQRRAVDVIARSARTQADLIEDLLDVSRIITGKMAIELREIDLAAPVRAAIDALRPTAEAKGVSLVPRLEGDPRVQGDPDRLQQVAWNLLSNAIKFTPAGGRVSVALAQRDGRGELRVTDSGIGIAPSFLPHVFERFQQHDSSTTRQHGGMGLGLAIVKHLVEAHGGTVHAESAGEGQGATFVVRLPLQARAAATGRAPRRGRRPQADEADLTGLKVLVVDDDPDALEMMTNVLTADGAEVRTAASASEALHVLERGGVDVLLSDIGMPGTDGYGLLREVRHHWSPTVQAVPAIAVTAYAGEGDRDAALEAGFQAHLPKPIDLASLHAVVRQVLQT